MEGVLWARAGRGKLLRGWQKRYFVLAPDGSLREFAFASDTEAHAASSSSTGLTLARELRLAGATAKSLPFPLAGRPHAFQVARKGAFRLALAARSSDEQQRWLAAVRAAIASAAGGDTASPSFAPATTPMTRSPSLEHRMSDEFVDVPALSARDAARFAAAHEWVGERVRATRDVALGGVAVPRGALLVAANGISLQTLSAEQVQRMLARPQSAPLGLRFLRAPHKKGVLRCKLCVSLSTQLRSLAQYRGASRREWTQQVVEVDGDVLTCYPRAESVTANKTRQLLPLAGGCTVKTVHELVAERKFCFVVSVKAHSMLFQARSDDEVRSWTETIQRAIQLADGALPGHDRASLDSLQLQSSLNMRNRQRSLLFGDDADELEHHHPQLSRFKSCSTLEEDGADHDSRPRLRGRATAAGKSWASAEASAPHLPAQDLSEMLFFLQRSGRLVEAFQLMGRNTSHRSEYWKKIFLWALDPVDDDAFQRLLLVPLDEADSVQVQKDIPRTAKWLAGSAGAPTLTADASRVRLERLENVLHAFLSGCTSHVRTDEDDDELSDDATASHEMAREGSKSFYMQGMNGLAFILLDVLAEDELVALQFFRGIIARILPHVFGIRSAGAERDYFDLFSSLVEVGNTLQDVVALHLPNFTAAMDDAGIPVCLLAYKWFPTLFSDISLMAHNAQLRYDTLLVIWDICLLMGLEGIFCVSLALFSAAEENVVGAGRDASAEQISNALVHVISQIKPEDLITSVCEVLELCSHHVLLKLRNGHRRRLQIGYSKQKYDGIRTSGSSSRLSRLSPPGASIGVDRSAVSATTRGGGGGDSNAFMTVKDLDSGKLFKISRSGSMLLPVMKAV